MIRHVFAFVLAVLVHLPAVSQVITTDPAFPKADEPVTVIFHSERGDKGLMNYSGDDVYAHTGVITDKSTTPTDWKYVKAEWTQNIASCKLLKVSDNEYQLSITPDIRSFYQVPETEKILKLAFVFRNANGSRTGRDIAGSDIFADVHEHGLEISIISPDREFLFAEENMMIPLQVNAIESDSIVIFLDNSRIGRTSSSAIDTTLKATGTSRHEIVAKAFSNNQSVSDTVWYMVPGETHEAPIGEGISDGINYVSDDSVVFVLFAPDKKHIYLIGDFNNWLPDSPYQLSREGDRFWIGVGNLVPGKEYAFQYIIDGELRIADPYAEKVLDPVHDQEIPETVYPNLRSYPASKTSQIAGVFQPGKPGYVWNDDDFIPPDAEDLVIYELLIRDFVESHDIKDVAEKLDYLQTLGVNAIELMPFSEFEGNSSWGYNPSFYFAVDKYYGTDTDFKDFINECHKRDIAVIMDIVLNHAYGQNPMVRMYFNPVDNRPAPNNPWFNEVSPNPVYQWGYDFNHESEATQYFIDRVLEYWLTEYKIDGFRFDFTKGFTNIPGDGSAYDAPRINTLKRIYNKIRSVNPNAYMICEHFAINSEEKELADYGILLWGNSNYNYNEATMGYINNSDFSWSSYQARGWSNPNLVSYMESHDEERLMFRNITYGNSSGDYNIRNLQTALKRMELAGLFFFTIPGPRMIWQFGELGYDYSIEYGDRLAEKPVRWDYAEDKDRYQVYLVWAKLIDLKKKYPVFQTSDYSLDVGNNIPLKKITLLHDDGDAIVIGNFGLTASDMQPEFTTTGWWYELFSGDSIEVSDVNQTINLQPGEYRIYAQKNMKSVINRVDEKRVVRIEIYPNPVKHTLYFKTGSHVKSLNIYDVSGSVVMKVENHSGKGSIDVSGLPEGFYIIRGEEKDRVSVGKFIRKN